MDDFVLIDTIGCIGDDHITGRKEFVRAPLWQGMETLAQLGAYHVRFLTSFERHAFLLKMNRWAASERHFLEGTFHLQGNLVGRSDAAFAYRLLARSGQGGVIEGEYLFGTVEYGSALNREVLQNHYRKVFSCLWNGSETDCCSKGRPVFTEILPK